MAWTTVISDSFTDTSGTNLTAHTIAPTNTIAASWLTTGNTMRVSNTGGNNLETVGGTRAYLNVDPDPDQAVALTMVGTDFDHYLFVRYQHNGGSHNAYRLEITSTLLGLRKITTGGAGGTLNSSTPTMASGDVIRMEIVGTNVTVLRNGSTEFTQDVGSDFTTGTLAMTYDHSVDGWGDNFLGETWSAGGGRILRPRRMMLGIGG